MAQPLVKKDDDRDGESIVSLIHSTTMVEATEVIFSVTKLFQSKDIGLRIMVYLIIKELSPSADEMLRIAEMPKLGFDLVVLLARRHELMIMDLGEKLRKFLKQTSWCGNLGLHLLWLIIHFFVGIWYFLSGIAHALESFLISSGLLKRYKTLNVSKIHHLAVAIDCEEARETSKVLELLQFLATIGVKNISLYDSEGVLKQSKEAIKEELSCIKFYEGNSLPTSLLHKYTNLEFVSLADGKHAMGKAANFLFVKHYAGTNLQKHTLTESDVTDALRVIGCGGSDPDLLLVYASARCHLGFPAWRLRYTEIVHMGPLKSMKFGSLVKAIYKFTMIHQNYGI